MTGQVTTGATEMAAPSNARLIRELEDRLACEPWISNFSVLIPAQAGILTLRGLVNTAAEIALETMARTVKGCKDVDSHLPSGRQAEIADTCSRWTGGVALGRDPCVAAGKRQAETPVSHGWPTGLVIRRADIPEGIWRHHYADAAYVEVGWGDPLPIRLDGELFKRVETPACRIFCRASAGNTVGLDALIAPAVGVAGGAGGFRTNRPGGPRSCYRSPKRRLCLCGNAC